MPPAPLDVRLARALSHPLRQRILMALDGQVASPSDLADRLGAPLGDVAYHTKRLLEHECVELVRTEMRRGAVKHFYTAVRQYGVEDPAWVGLEPEERRRLATQVLGQLLNDVHAAQGAGRLAADDVHLSRTPLDLDAEAVSQLNALLREVVTEALRLQAASRSRRGEGRAAPEHRRLAVLHYEPADPGAGPV